MSKLDDILKGKRQGQTKTTMRLINKVREEEFMLEKFSIEYLKDQQNKLWDKLSKLNEQGEVYWSQNSTAFKDKKACISNWRTICDYKTVKSQINGISNCLNIYSLYERVKREVA